MGDSPRNDDVEMANGTADDKPDAKVIVITSLTRNVVDAHLRTIFGFYGEITKLDLPVYPKSGQNRGKAALEYTNPSDAHLAASHMNGGQIDGVTVKVELSDLPVRSRPPSPAPPRRARVTNGRDRSRSASYSRSPRSRSPPPRKRSFDRGVDSFRGRPYGRRGPPPRRSYRSYRSRSRSPIRGGRGHVGGVARRSPSYERGGTGYRGRSRSRSASYSVRSSRSRTRSRSRSFTPRSRSRSRSYSYSRSRSRSRSYSRSRSWSGSRGRRSHSRDDIRDSRSRSPPPPK